MQVLLPVVYSAKFKERKEKKKTHPANLTDKLAIFFLKRYKKKRKLSSSNTQRKTNFYKKKPFFVKKKVKGKKTQRKKGNVYNTKKNFFRKVEECNFEQRKK